MRFLHATTLHIIWSPLWRARLQIMVWGLYVTEGLCPNILRIRGIHILQSEGCKLRIFSVYQFCCSLFSCRCHHTELQH